MATQYAVLKGLPAGLTFTSAKLFAVSAPDTVVTGNTFSLSNRTNATSQYVVSIERSPTALPAGDYTLIAYIGTAAKAELDCTFVGTDGETATETPEAAVLNSAGQAMVTAFNAMRVGNVFTAPALANAPTGSGGGDNTEVLDAIDSMKSLIAEWIALNIPSDVRGFPATIIGGTDVTVSLEVVDSNNDPITEIFGESVETVQWLFGMGTSARRARILGSVDWVSDLLQITITRAETLDDDDGPRTWMIGCKLTSGEVKWVKTGVTRLIGRQFAEPTTTTTGA